MSEDAKFVSGIRLFDKHPNAPDFVIGSIVISPNELWAWIQANPGALTQYNGNPQVKLQMKRSQGGKLYAELDTYKPQPAAAPQGYAPAPQQGYQQPQAPQSAPQQQYAPAPQQGYQTAPQYAQPATQQPYQAPQPQQYAAPAPPSAPPF